MNVGLIAPEPLSALGVAVMRDLERIPLAPVCATVRPTGSVRRTSTSARPYKRTHASPRGTPAPAWRAMPPTSSSKTSENTHDPHPCF